MYLEKIWTAWVHGIHSVRLDFFDNKVFEGVKRLWRSLNPDIQEIDDDSEIIKNSENENDSEEDDQVKEKDCDGEEPRAFEFRAPQLYGSHWKFRSPFYRMTMFFKEQAEYETQKNGIDQRHLSKRCRELDSAAKKAYIQEKLKQKAREFSCYNQSLS